MQKGLLWSVCLIIVSIVCSCASYDKSTLYQELPKWEEPERRSEKQYSEKQVSIEEIDKLRPQIAPPIHLAIAQPYGHGWLAGEAQLIEDLIPELEKTGFVKEVTLLPSSITGNRYSDFIKEARLGAAKAHADAVLVLCDATHTHKTVNFFSIFNLLIAGLWIAPGHNRESYVIMEGFVLDTANGYMYGTIRGEGEHSVTKAYMYAEDDDGQAEARVIAIQNLGKKLIELSKKIAEKNKK